MASLDRYCKNLWKINESLNLTRHTNYDLFVRRDVIDSLQLEPFLESGDQVLDVGTGGGVPGVLLAIFRSDVVVTLCDSVEKKAVAVQSIVAKAGLNLEVFHGRAQDLVEVKPVDTLVARAVAPMKKMLTWLQPCWANFSQLLLIKGPRWVEERHEAKEKGLLDGLEIRKIAEYQTPGNDHPSVIVRIRPE